MWQSLCGALIKETSLLDIAGIRIRVRKNPSVSETTSDFFDLKSEKFLLFKFTKLQLLQFDVDYINMSLEKLKNISNVLLESYYGTLKICQTFTCLVLGCDPEPN
jgi:hypothetical protein